MPNPDDYHMRQPETLQPPVGMGELPFRTTTVTSLQYADERETLLQLASEILQDPLAMQHLCDRVYILMQQDLQRQQERQRGYGRRS